MSSELLIFVGAFGGITLFISGFLLGKKMADEIGEYRLVMELETEELKRCYEKELKAQS